MSLLWTKCGGEGETTLQLEIRPLSVDGARLVISLDWMRDMAVRPTVCCGLSLRCHGCSSTQTATTVRSVQGARRCSVPS